MRRAKPKSGQSLVEFALLLVVFLAMLIGIMDWSWTMFMHETLVSRASMAARWAAVRPAPDPASDTGTAAGIKDIVLYGKTPCTDCTSAFGLARTSVTAARVEKTYVVSSVEPVSTYHVVVTISNYTVQHFTPVLGLSFNGRTITASHEWECLYDDCRVP